MVSLKARSPSPETELEDASLSRSREAEASRRRRRRSSPKARDHGSRRRREEEERSSRRDRGRPSPKEKRRESSPPPLRRRVEKERHSSPRSHRRSRHHDEIDEGRHHSEKHHRGREEHRGREDPRGREDHRAREALPKEKQKSTSDAQARNLAAQLEAQRSLRNAVQSVKKALDSGAAPKRASKKGGSKDLDSDDFDDLDGEPIGAGRPSVHIDEADLDGVPIEASQRPPAHANTSGSDEEDNSSDVGKDSAGNSGQGRETFQERLRRKQMERYKPPEISVAPDRSALQVAAMAIKAAAKASSDEKTVDKEEPPKEVQRTLSISERTRRCAERAAALGLSCDFVNGRLLPPDRAAALISRGRRRRRGEELDDMELNDLPPPAPSDPAPPLPAPEPEVDPETVIRANEAAQAAMSFEDFIKQRSRAAAEAPKLAPVSEDLQRTIEVAEQMRAKKLKRKKKGRDFDYHPDLDGESMSSSEEQRCMDTLDGDSMDSADEREGLSCPTTGQSFTAKKRLVGHIKDIYD